VHVAKYLQLKAQSMTAVDDAAKTLGQLKLKSAGNSNYFQFFIAL